MKQDFWYKLPQQPVLCPSVKKAQKKNVETCTKIFHVERGGVITLLRP
jgi:hypothetical protein